MKVSNKAWYLLDVACIMTIYRHTFLRFWLILCFASTTFIRVMVKGQQILMFYSAGSCLILAGTKSAFLSQSSEISNIIRSTRRNLLNMSTLHMYGNAGLQYWLGPSLQTIKLIPPVS